MTHLFGIPLLLLFLALFWRRAEPVTVEEYEEEDEFSTDDPISFRVESDKWLPVGVERE